MLQTSFFSNIKKGSNSINTGDRVTIIAFCNFPHSCLSVYQVSLNCNEDKVVMKTFAPDKSVTDGRLDGNEKQ